MARGGPTQGDHATTGWSRRLRGSVDARLLWRLARTYAVSAVAGAAATQIYIPLPWMLGPFFVWAAIALIGPRPQLVPMGRELAQVAIGVVVGMRFTLPILLATAGLLPAIFLGTVYMIAVTVSAAALLAWLARLDHVTAFFATAAGGVADMAAVAKTYGGTAQAVAVVHALRYSLVVAIVPFAVFFFGEHGPAMELTDEVAGSVLLVPVVLFLGYLGARALKPTPLPNPWLVGPIFVGVALGLSGIFAVHFPPIVVIVAQIALGTWLGAQIHRDQMTALPRVTLIGLVIACYMIVGAALGAAVISAATGLPFTTSFLGLAPASITEMVLTATAMNLDAEAVIAFHIMRIALVSSTVLIVFKLYLKLRGVRLEPRI